MIALLKYWRVIAAVGIFFAGWHAQTIYNGYIADKAKTNAIENLGEGMNEIVKFNGKLDKAVRKANDDCINRAIAPDIRLLLTD